MAALVNLESIRRLAALGESETLELKRSTGQLDLAGKTLCAFLNTNGGTVLVGVSDDGTIGGQEVSDTTRRQIAAMLNKFEPPAAASVDVQYVDTGGGAKKIIVMSVEPLREARPFMFDGKAFQRVETTTSTMPLERLKELLDSRSNPRLRWEKQHAAGVTLEDLDVEEILRTRESAIRQHRIDPTTPADAGDILDRLDLRQDGMITQAAQILYGTRFMPSYPQGLLKLGRFRGTKITGPIVDNRQERFHAFAMVREAMAWLSRTLPLGARFPPGEIFREDRLPVPVEALREVVLNAVIHRDFTLVDCCVEIAVFDDRIEVRSTGSLPTGITVKSLSASHRSVRRNPLIAEAFHRTGAIEVWGRGTNRVIEACVRHGSQPPTFEEKSGAVYVTLRAQIGPEPPKPPPSLPQVDAVARAVLEAAVMPRTRAELQAVAGLRDRKHFRTAILDPLVDAGLLSLMIPDKPRSPHQRYQTVAIGGQLTDRSETASQAPIKRPPSAPQAPPKRPPSAPQAPPKHPPSTPQVATAARAVLEAAVTPRTCAELQAAAGLRDRKHFRAAILSPLVDAGLLSLTIPDKPRSSRQRYQTTAAGGRMLDQGKE